MFTKSFVPYKGYWSTPFCKWQGSFQNEDSVELAAATTRQFLKLRGFDPNVLDGIVYGSTIPKDGPFMTHLFSPP